MTQLRRILRRLARRATTPVRTWIDRPQREAQAMAKITLRINTIERGLL